MQVQGGVAEEGKDDTGHEGLQHLQPAWQGVHIAGDLFEPVVVPHKGHIYAIKYRSDTGECIGCRGPVPERPIRQEPDVDGGVDNGGQEAEEGGVAGVGDGEVVPEEGKA